jgi:N-acylneuraminate cytidylyltransferase
MAEPPQKIARTEAAIPPGVEIDRTRIYAVVPARAGSKGVKGKNIKDFCGKPLMAWQIENGVKSKFIKRTFVSTDSEEYRQVALKHGAEAPFLRPKEISHDTATDFQLFEHFLGWMRENEPERQPSLLVQLRPTAPCLSVATVDAAIEKFLLQEAGDFDSLRTITPVDHEAFNMYFLDPSGSERLLPVIPTSHHKDDPSHIIPEPQSVARQILPKIYWHNAYIDILRPRVILDQKCCMGKRCLAFHMGPEDTADIDTPEQWAEAETKKRAQLAAAASATTSAA